MGNHGAWKGSLAAMDWQVMATQRLAYVLNKNQK